MRRPFIRPQMPRDAAPRAEPEGIAGCKQDGWVSTAGEQHRDAGRERDWPGQAFRPKARQEREMARRSGDERGPLQRVAGSRSEEHTSELQSLMRNSYAVFCLKKKKKQTQIETHFSLTVP